VFSVRYKLEFYILVFRRNSRCKGLSNIFGIEMQVTLEG
jgi:hypothetical protein